MDVLRLYLPQIAKALVGALATLVLTFLSKAGIDTNMSLGDFVQMIASGILTGVTIWLVPNKKK